MDYSLERYFISNHKFNITPTKPNIMKFFNSTTLINVTVLLCSMFFFYSCSSDDNSSPSGIVNPPIILDCNYFDENDEIHLTDDPDAPVDYVIVCYANIGNKD